MSDQVGSVFAALSDSTRRWMVETLLREGTATVPSLSAELPMSRQAVAKHLSALDEAGIVQRLPPSGREVPYALRPGALDPAAGWLRSAEAEWDTRLSRLKDAVERPSVE